VRPRMGHLTVSVDDSAVSGPGAFLAAALATGVAAALLVAATPARSAPLDPWPAARPHAQHSTATARPIGAATARPLVVATARAKDKAVVHEDEVTARAKAAKAPFNVLISLEKQQLTLYSGTEVIARSRVSTGTAGHTTPSGVFSVIQKDRWHRSNIYGNAPMFFMQRITWSGVAMHQGVVPNYPASHGCIRLPEAFAKQMWGITQMGARVIITRNEVAPVAASHPRLFVFRQEPVTKPDPGETVASSSELVRAAYNALDANQLAGSRTAAGPTATDAPKPLDPALNAAAREKPLKSGPISVFVSRKEGKLFVRKGFDPVFDAPVSFSEPDQPLGTHVFTALALKDDNTNLDWMVVTLPTTTALIKKAERSRKGEAVHAPAPIHTTAAQALERINIPQDARERIEALMSAGASLIISDSGISGETGRGTDFIVLTR
jgi:lipoprotein-anchoring transpeptidase ErfK/SrfK